MTRSINADTQPVRLADDQFDKIVELLTPGHTLAQAYLARMADEHDAAVAAETAKPAKKTRKK